MNNATLNRFFALHFVLPFVLAALALMHMIALHDSAGSGNPLGVSGNYDRLPFAPYFIFKDLVTIFLFILVLSIFVFFMPNVLGDSDNYIMANPMQTPPAIVPEWYLLPFYAILRSIPNKLLGVVAMLSAILILLVMPFVDLSRSRGIQFRPLSKIAYYVFIANFLILMQLGAKHVESPFIEFGQISTVLYFAHFLIIVPMVSLLENSLIELAINEKKVIKKNTRGQIKVWNKREGIKNVLFDLFIWFIIIVLFLLIFISDDGEDISLFRTAHAEDTDSEEEENVRPKRDKGKGRASEAEISQQMANTHPQNLTESDYDSDSENGNISQVKYDLLFAKSLQEEYDREYAKSLPVISDEDDNAKSPSSNSEYTVYSSDMHSDDSDHTKNQKMLVKEKEKLLREEYDLKRKNSPDSDVIIESSNKRSKSSKD